MSKTLRPSAGYMGRGVIDQSAVEYMLYHQKSFAQVKPASLCRPGAPPPREPGGPPPPRALAAPPPPRGGGAPPPTFFSLRNFSHSFSPRTTWFDCFQN